MKTVLKLLIPEPNTNPTGVLKVSTAVLTERFNGAAFWTVFVADLGSELRNDAVRAKVDKATPTTVNQSIRRVCFLIFIKCCNW